MDGRVLKQVLAHLGGDDHESRLAGKRANHSINTYFQPAAPPPPRIVPDPRQRCWGFHAYELKFGERVYDARRVIAEDQSNKHFVSELGSSFEYVRNGMRVHVCGCLRATACARYALDALGRLLRTHTCQVCSSLASNNRLRQILLRRDDLIVGTPTAAAPRDPLSRTNLRYMPRDKLLEVARENAATLRATRWALCRLKRAHLAACARVRSLSDRLEE
jgi:hypothetical protein